MLLTVHLCQSTTLDSNLGPWSDVEYWQESIGPLRVRAETGYRSEVRNVVLPNVPCVRRAYLQHRPHIQHPYPIGGCTPGSNNHVFYAPDAASTIDLTPSSGHNRNRQERGQEGHLACGLTGQTPAAKRISWLACCSRKRRTS